MIWRAFDIGPFAIALGRAWFAVARDSRGIRGVFVGFLGIRVR